jgi:hypothetical protein
MKNKIKIMQLLEQNLKINDNCCIYWKRCVELCQISNLEFGEKHLFSFIFKSNFLLLGHKMVSKNLFNIIIFIHFIIYNNNSLFFNSFKLFQQYVLYNLVYYNILFSIFFICQLLNYTSTLF